VFLGDAVYF